MTLASFIVFSLSLVSAVNCFVTEENALEYFETMNRKLSKNPTFSLGSEWREADGTLLKARLLQSSTSPVQQCGAASTTQTIPATSQYPALEYQLIDTSTSQACIWLSTALSAIDINYNPTSKTPITANQQITTGIECTNCWAYVGATLSFSLDCTLTVGASGLSAGCSIGFSTGGGIGYNLAVSMNNPTFTFSTPPLNVVPLPAGAPNNIASTTYQTLFYDPTTGIFISAVPALQVTVTGTGSATGTANLAAGFNTNANLQMGLTSSFVFTEGFSTAITLTPASLTSNLQLSSASVTVQLNATVYWQMGLKVPATGTPTAALYATFQTSIPANYTYFENFVASSAIIPETSLTNLRVEKEEVSQSKTTSIRNLASSTCGSRDGIQLDGSMSAVGLTVVGFTDNIALNEYAPPQVLYSSNQGATCLTAGTTPAPAPTSASSDGSSPSSNTLSSGELAAAIVVPILFVAVTGFMVYYFYFKKASLGESTK